MKDNRLEMLYGLNKLRGKESSGHPIYTPAVIIGDPFDEHGLRVGQPGIIIEDHLSENSLSMAFPFPHKEGHRPRENFRMSSSCVRPMRFNSSLNSYRAKKLDIFNKSARNMVIEKAKTKGMATFLLSDHASLKFAKAMRLFLSQFKYNHVYTFRSRHYKEVIRDKSDTIQPVLTVFNLSFCIPVFNSRKADGIGFSLEFVLPKSSKAAGRVKSFAYIAMLLSQNRENLFYLDGVRIRKDNPISKDTIEQLSAIADVRIGGKKEKKTKKAKTKKTDWLDSEATWTSITDTSTEYYYTR